MKLYIGLCMIALMTVGAAGVIRPAQSESSPSQTPAASTASAEKAADADQESTTSTESTKQPAAAELEPQLTAEQLEAQIKADKRAGLVALNSQRTVLIDPAGKRVILRAFVCQTSAALEMLCCIKGTKQHESILALNARAYLVHAALLALNARPGKPVSWNPEYKPASGQKIDIYLNWTDENGKPQRCAAQDWMRHSVMRYFEYSMKSLPSGFKLPEDSELRYDTFTNDLLWFGPMTKQQRDELLKLSADADYQKAIRFFYKSGQSRPMTADWVFAGSRMSRDFETGKTIYQAEGGDLICVANFPSALLDLTSESSKDDSNRLYEAWPDRVPKKGTPVTIELIPRFQPTATQQKKSK